MKRFNLKELATLFLRPKLTETLQPEEWFHFVLILREAKLLASFYHMSIKENVFSVYPLFVQKHLKSAHVRAGRQKAQVLFECNTLDSMLKQIDVIPIYMKGANYILRNSSNGQGRLVSDIDVLVNEHEITKVENYLKTKLWLSEKLSDYDDKYYRAWAHEIPPLFHPLRGTVLDIHHNIYLPISGRSPNISNFTHSIQPEGCTSQVMNDPATVLHSIIHLFMNEDFTNAFRDMLDIHMLCEDLGCDNFWNEILKLSQDSGFDKELYYSLALRAMLFDCSPPNIFSQLKSKYHGSINEFFIKRILYSALSPKHSLLDTPSIKIARFIVFIRGHWLKMPLPILIKHIVVKSYFGAIEKLFGKHFLDKD
ncbi:nucleotidyltransferase family protein [Paraglaciecola sp.]|uniref:nucleotidyltransferase family protein n=1 Tax=Paraglaciecola sp. TaxID=1920173 RepID=UPI003EF93763